MRLTAQTLEDLFLHVNLSPWGLRSRQMSVKLLRLARCSISFITRAFPEFSPFSSLSVKAQLKSPAIIIFFVRIRLDGFEVL